MHEQARLSDLTHIAAGYGRESLQNTESACLLLKVVACRFNYPGVNGLPRWHWPPFQKAK